MADIPTLNNFTKYIFEDFSLKQLKDISKKYKLKTSMKKELLIKNIKSSFEQQKNATKIQSIVRRWFVNEWMKSHGPGGKSRNCVNETDFLTIEPLTEIPFQQFFSFEEKTCDYTHVYGFDLISINTLIKSSDASNPYNRKKLDKNVIRQFKKLLSLSHILCISITTEVKEEEEKTLDQKCLDLFQKMNELGHYSNHVWFLEMQKRQLIKFIRDLYDIWFYRCQLTNEMHRNISPRGSPFRYINIYRLQEETDQMLREKIIKTMEELVYYGIDIDSKTLGAYYVLGALTLSNRNAADAIPWLFETFL